eukprot:m.14072 g.14072  ORF g.14072 m.14072 type:complete len:385 (+) comp9996_c0_seq1:152-1306(+)
MRTCLSISIVVASMIAGVTTATRVMPVLPWRGVDMSQIATEANQSFRLYSNESALPPMQILADRGVNAFRMRMWNNPCADGRCDPTLWSYANLTGVLAIARECKAAKLQFILDFHYSDWWADPGKQFKPTAWVNLTFDEMSVAMEAFSKETVLALVQQGTPPSAVQIGNEITNGFLWNTSNQPCSQGAQLWCGGEANNASWARFGRLVASGIRGVKAACPGCAIAIHTDLGNHIIKAGISFVVKWYTLLLEHLEPHLDDQHQPTAPLVTGFDMIGLSMYPTWDDGHTLESIAQLSVLAAAFPTVAIYIAETSYPADGKTQPEHSFPPTPQGQLGFIKAVQNALHSALPAHQNAGYLWWEANEHSWNSLFDENFVARPALLQGFQ